MNIIPASKIPGVYCITNTVNNKIYVGSSGSIYQRTARHKCDLLKNRHANSHLQSAVNKYGIDKFEISLIKIDDYYLSWEQFYIDWWKPDYNKNISATTVILQQSSRDKISATLKQRYLEGMPPTRPRPVSVCDCNGNLVQSFDTKKEAAKFVRGSESKIWHCLTGKYSTHRGFTYTDRGKPCPSPVSLNSAGIKRKTRRCKIPLNGGSPE